MKKRKYGPQELPKELVIFWNDSRSESYLQITENDSDAFIETADEEKVVGVYRLEKRVKLRFRVEREAVGKP